VTLAFALAIAHPSRGRAQDDAVETARCAEFGDEDDAVAARLADARAAIGRHEDDMRHWWSAFLVLHSVMMGASLTFALTAPDDGARAELSVQAISSGLGLITLLTSTSPLIGAGGHLDSLSESTPDDRLRKLVEAESILRRSADGVSFIRGPLSSVLSGGYGLAASLTLLLGFQRTTGAILLAIGASVIGQGRLLLHPWGIRDERRRYRRAHEDAGCPLPPPPPEVLSARLAPRWAFTFGAGLTFHLAF
jgi:hypothetical protein